MSRYVNVCSSCYPHSVFSILLLLPALSVTLVSSAHAATDAELAPQRVGQGRDPPHVLRVGDPSIVADDLKQQAGMECLGSLEGTHARYYAVTVERQLEHPAVQAICDAARTVEA